MLVINTLEYLSDRDRKTDDEAIESTRRGRNAIIIIAAAIICISFHIKPGYINPNHLHKTL
jgi:hypothetical protein